MIDFDFKSLKKESYPFDHWIVDDFLEYDIAKKLADSFPQYDDSCWHHYSNSIEEKKTLNNWNLFDELQYKIFSELNSNSFTKKLSDLVGVELYADSGLHGGGLHIHGESGNLNPHLDYSIHPKLKLQRKINIIIYMEPRYNEKMGGHLGLWEAGENFSKNILAKEVAPLFNRAIIFDTTQNSWHGMSRRFNYKPNIYRKSLAVYYLTEPSRDANERERALFAPRDEQRGNLEVEDLIRKRADSFLYKTVYKNE